MDMVALLCIVLFTVSAVIVAMVVINKRKRQREVEEERRKAEHEAKQRAEEKERQRFEETRHKAEEERKHLGDETQQKAKEGEQNRLAEESQKAREGRRKAEEARKRDEEKSQRKTEKALGKGQRQPLKRGGRPRGSTKRSEMEQEPEAKPHALKPEIVCWKEGWSWVIGIEVPEELETLSVAQNEELLEQDNIDESRYRLKYAKGTVKVTWTEGEIDTLLAGAGGNCLIFKMRKDWKGPGRLIRCSTTGYYLIIVPQEWERDEEVTDPAPVAPESVQLGGYKAHFFCQEQKGNIVIGFVTLNGERIEVESGSPRFQLVGSEIGDASEYMGPLFAEQPPRIQALDEKGWSDVGVIVVGEEGSGRNRWRTQFVPQVNVKEQKIPEKVANRRGGWYFLRIYDNDDSLLESMDFRFMTVLKDIRIESSDCLPCLSGYENVTVQFLHQTGCKVELMDEDTQYALEVHRECGQTIVTVPPKPDCDKTHWILRDGDAEIEATVLVERIWWAFGIMGVAPTDWVDKPITLSRKDFTAITDKALWVRLPRRRWVRKIDVGFNRTKSRSYQVEVEKKELAVPLRDFCDAEELGVREKKCRFIIWVQPKGAKLGEIAIAQIPPEAPIPVKPTKRPMQKPVLIQEQVPLLRAMVKCPFGKRKGKGFSRKELIEAGITMENIKHFSIPYDKRRKTSHLGNIKRLRCTENADAEG